MDITPVVREIALPEHGDDRGTLIALESLSEIVPFEVRLVCLRWVSVAVHGLSLAAVSGVSSSLWYQGLSSRWLLLLQSSASRAFGRQ